MKDIVIKGKHIRRELYVWLGCIVAMTLWNAYAICVHHTSWQELYSLWYVILPLSVVLYLVLALIRWVALRIARMLCRCRSKKQIFNP